MLFISRGVKLERDPRKPPKVGHCIPLWIETLNSRYGRYPYVRQTPKLPGWSPYRRCALVSEPSHPPRLAHMVLVARMPLESEVAFASCFLRKYCFKKINIQGVFF